MRAGLLPRPLPGNPGRLPYTHPPPPLPPAQPKGIVEFADLIVVNKADGELKGAAGRAAAEYSSASRLMRARLQCWVPQVLECSAHTSR